MLLHCAFPWLAAHSESGLREYESGVEGEQRGSNQRSLFLLITPWTAVSTGRSYSSTLGKVEPENRRILVSEAGVARTVHLRGCLCAAPGVCACWVEKMERTSRRWWTVWGAWGCRGRKRSHAITINNTIEVNKGNKQEENFYLKMQQIFTRAYCPSMCI